MADLRDLAFQMKALADKLPTAGSELATRVAIEIVTALVRTTPVDTSEALSNWQVTLGSPGASRIPPYVKGKEGSTEEISAERTILEAVAILKTKQPGQSIWIQNVLPYIRVLNDGSSHQAPAGFVERAQLIGRKTAEQGLALNV